MKKKLLLAGDVGGTKTHLAIFSETGGLASPVAEVTFRSNDFPSFVEMAKKFLGEYSLAPKVLCLGVAGPVLSGGVRIEKLSWQISEAELQKSLGVTHALLLNDLVATAHAIPVLQDDDLFVINKGERESRGPKVVVAPGTGLGEAFITFEGENEVVHASEGGHSLFAPQTSKHLELLEYAYEKYGQITNDLICSGRGIPIIYEFLRQQSTPQTPSLEANWLREKLEQNKDKTPVIVAAAIANDPYDRIPKETIELFVEILASECANFALKILAGGGVFLGGGIPPRIIDFLRQKSFMTHFSKRYPMEGYLNNVPVSLIKNSKAALLGAAHVGLMLLGRYRE